MDAKEALKCIDAHRVSGWQEAWPGFLSVAEAALREKVEREEKDRKPTLAEMQEACESGAIQRSMTRFYDDQPKLLAAADVLKRLREDGGKLLRNRGACGAQCAVYPAFDFLLSLGVEASK